MNSVAVLAGPTASGKTAVALEYAIRHGALEIVSADSMLVYRSMDIGTAKPAAAEMSGIRHHLMDICDPDRQFTAGDFVRHAKAAIEDIHARGRRALVAGGTGFYLKALMRGMWTEAPASPELRVRLENLPDAELFEKLAAVDSGAAAKIGRRDRYRLVRALELFEATGTRPSELASGGASAPDPMFKLLVIDRERAELADRIRLRTKAMLSAGLLEEARSLASRFPGAKALGAVGYKQTLMHLEGHIPAGRKYDGSLLSLENEIALATRQLVKAQRTWFRSQKEAEHFLLDRDLPTLKERLDGLYGR
ncbi:MAG: tRNA (adenosine(37)-N6)-dimethylallyltransferase MiaA [Bdellovibrionales bacterium RIFOXYD1_FULL_53_11]|nr:MAG: tRNA (adenosine(37)-N6)-dimethylallyltransferase MiaA [Bdellovibrionales bacterium RIFOXYD1_FULL_53_11]